VEEGLPFDVYDEDLRTKGIALDWDIQEGHERRAGMKDGAMYRSRRVQGFGGGEMLIRIDEDDYGMRRDQDFLFFF
jgi:hypothetical protein